MLRCVVNNNNNACASASPSTFGALGKVYLHLTCRGWRPLLVVRLKLKDSGRVNLNGCTWEIAAPLFMPPRVATRFARAQNRYGCQFLCSYFWMKKILFSSRDPACQCCHALGSTCCTTHARLVCSDPVSRVRGVDVLSVWSSPETHRTAWKSHANQLIGGHYRKYFFLLLTMNIMLLVLWTEPLPLLPSIPMDCTSLKWL